MYILRTFETQGAFPPDISDARFIIRLLIADLVNAFVEMFLVIIPPFSLSHGAWLAIFSNHALCSNIFCALGGT